MRAEEEKKLAALVLALGVFIALLFPALTNLFAPYLLPALFFVMVFSLLPFARHSGMDLINLHPIVIVLVGWQQFMLPILTLAIAIGWAAQQPFVILMQGVDFTVGHVATVAGFGRRKFGAGQGLAGRVRRFFAHHMVVLAMAGEAIHTCFRR